MGQTESFQRNIGDLLGITVLPKAEAFAFFRLLVNLDPEIAAAERLKYNGHVDYHMASLPLACTRERHSRGRGASGSAVAQRAAGQYLPEHPARSAGARDQLHPMHRVQTCSERQSHYDDPHGAKPFPLVAMGGGYSFDPEHDPESRKSR